MLTCCAAKVNDVYRVSVGARPMRAVCLTDEAGILNNGITPETAAAFGTWVSEQVTTGSNVRASADYRKKMMAVLTKRNVMELAAQGNAVCSMGTQSATEQCVRAQDIAQENEAGGRI